MVLKRVYYVWDENLIEQCDRLPAVPGRASMVHNLIMAYGLLPNMTVVRSKKAGDSDLKMFHSDLYMKHLETFSEVDEEYMATNEDEEYGIGYDCPPVSNMSELVSTLAGGSITAARCLTLGLTDLVLNWCGGWHHANRHGAEGFCYINDIVLAIEHLREKFPKVLYIDLDIHHGNGVQDAYNLSKSVFTLSIHKYEPGFYPGTGGLEDIGSLTGKGYSCNFPLHGFYSDHTLESIFEKRSKELYSSDIPRLFPLVVSRFAPDAIVMQCGADALAHDPNGGAGVTARGYCACVRRVLETKKPTLLLGGGGYNHPNAARLWTSITALATGVTLDENIPEHDHWPEYGPDYTLSVQPTLTKDINQKNYLEDCIVTIENNLNIYLKQNKFNSESNKSQPIQPQKRLFQKENNSPSKDVKTTDVYDFVE